jgi:hypothetical protein
MATALTKFASFFRPICKGSDEVVAIKLHPKAVTLAEVRLNSNVINIDNLASVGLPRQLGIHNLGRSQDMVVDTLRTMHERDMNAAQDAGIIIPSGIVTLRQINLPFMSPTELTKERRGGQCLNFIDKAINLLQREITAGDRTQHAKI